MATYTPNYQLHQWEPEDNFMRTDFNTDFSKIDTAIKKVKTDGDSALASAKQSLGASITTVQNSLNSVNNNLSATKCEVYVGGYSGDGTYSRLIDLGFAPKAVILEEHRLRSSGSATYGGLAVQGRDLMCNGMTVLSLCATGFYVYYYDNTAHTNQTNCTYQYVAFK